jgi:hypothetical protein
MCPRHTLLVTIMGLPLGHAICCRTATEGLPIAQAPVWTSPPTLPTVGHATNQQLHLPTPHQLAWVASRPWALATQGKQVKSLIKLLVADGATSAHGASEVLQVVLSQITLCAQCCILVPALDLHLPW